MNLVSNNKVVGLAIQNSTTVVPDSPEEGSCGGHLALLIVDPSDIVCLLNRSNCNIPALFTFLAMKMLFADKLNSVSSCLAFASVFGAY